MRASCPCSPIAALNRRTRFGRTNRIYMQCGVLKAKTQRMISAMCANAQRGVKRVAFGATLCALVSALPAPGWAQHSVSARILSARPLLARRSLAMIPSLSSLTGAASWAPRTCKATLAARSGISIPGEPRCLRSEPEAYVPGFGGYDPVAIASGVAVAGSPDIHCTPRRANISSADPRTARCRKPGYSCRSGENLG